MRVVKYHPLPDGNKRTGYDVMREFVERNGRAWTHGSGGLNEAVMMIRRLAGEPPPLSEVDFINWVVARVS